MKKLSILLLVIGAALMMSFTESPVNKDVTQFDSQKEVNIEPVVFEHCTSWTATGGGSWIQDCVCQCGLITRYTGVFSGGTFVIVKVEQL